MHGALATKSRPRAVVVDPAGVARAGASDARWPDIGGVGRAERRATYLRDRAARRPRMSAVCLKIRHAPT